MCVSEGEREGGVFVCVSAWGGGWRKGGRGSEDEKGAGACVYVCGGKEG